MKKNNTVIAKSLKKAGFYEKNKNKDERINIINNVTTKPERLKIVDKLFGSFNSLLYLYIYQLIKTIKTNNYE